MKRLVVHPVLVTVLVAGLTLGGLPLASPGNAAAAAPRADGLLDVLLPPERPTAADVWSSDGFLDRGRQKHAYRYRVETDEAYWSLELFLLDPKGNRIASAYQVSGADSASGLAHFRFWAQGTRPGRFTIKARLTWGNYDRTERWLEPRTFRLRRR